MMKKVDQLWSEAAKKTAEAANVCAKAETGEVDWKVAANAVWAANTAWVELVTEYSKVVRGIN